MELFASTIQIETIVAARPLGPTIIDTIENFSPKGDSTL